MNRLTILSLSAVAAGALVSGGIALQQRGELDAGNTPVPAEPLATPVTLVELHPFQLLEPATHYYRSEQPSFDSGWLVVLQTEPELLVPRQGYEPVLYFGDETVERINFGADSGYVIGVVPDTGQGDLGSQPIFFGSPELPEQVTAATAAAERDAAFSSGVGAVGAGAISAATRDAIAAEDHGELHTLASYLVEKYSPTERSLIDGLRVERIDR